MNEEVFAYCAICEKEHMLLRIDPGTAINEYHTYLCKVTDKFFLLKRSDDGKRDSTQ
jgi:hypothetical protein